MAKLYYPMCLRLPAHAFVLLSCDVICDILKALGVYSLGFFFVNCLCDLYHCLLAKKCSACWRCNSWYI